jgi:hypothetical protein
VATVNPGLENVLTLAIADTSDDVLDSAALIQSGSFTVCGGPGQPPCGGTTVPEPTTLVLFGLGMAGIAGLKKRSKGGFASRS